MTDNEDETPSRSLSSLVIGDGMIAGFNNAASPPEHDIVVFPGFIDVHCHGAVGVDVNTATADDLLKVSAYLARQGVTAWVPTLVPDSDEVYASVIAAIDEAMERQTELAAAQIVGVHYEGVFASEKMCGALRPEFFKTFTGSEVKSLPRLKSGVHMTTLAPEVEGGIDLIRELVGQGWIVSIGHTRADTATLDQALAAGARHMTHFYNAMTGIHHRDVGVAGWGLTTDEVTFDIIADGIHVAPRMVEFACRTKSPEKVVMISDSVAPTGLGDGSYDLWDEKISVVSGRTRNERGSIAGSVSSVLDCVKVMREIGFSDEEISLMASANPARLLGLRDRGSLEVGKRADLVGFDQNGDLEFTMIGGRVVQM